MAHGSFEVSSPLHIHALQVAIILPSCQTGVAFQKELQSLKSKIILIMLMS
jgi:hypothetical protein